jgi:thiol-disulfide isomerase/thioredoxin
MVVQLVAIFALYHHFGRIYFSSREGRENQGPKVDSNLRSRDLRDIAGDPVVLPPRGMPAVLLFTDTRCPLCDKLRPQLRSFAEAHADIQTVVICSGDRAAVGDWASGIAAAVPVVSDPGHRVAAYYDVVSIPYCVAVDDTGTVRGAGLVNSRSGLEEAAELANPPGVGGASVSPIAGFREALR